MELRESIMENEPEPFAVDLSNDGIFLWHRKPAKKWEFLGSVPLNSGNLRQQLEELSVVAVEAGAPSNHAIVRIPTAEVQTLTIDHKAHAGMDLESKIIDAIESVAGAPIKTLAFDIDRSDADKDINIAWTPLAVIKQAETFVHLIGFEPTHYTTDLDVSVFPRNPRFQPADYIETPETVSDINTEPPETTTSGLQSTQFETSTSADTRGTDLWKGDIKPAWLAMLLFIIALMIAAIYFWPHYDLSVIFG
jgi:hypothetical protein